MKTIGIIAEYNPFHYGHQAQYAAVREKFGQDCAIVVALGSSFTQRGEPARFTKLARAEAAVRCGADLVLELPLPWAASSAEGFARGGVAVLNALRRVDTLVFGSECADGERLAMLADVLTGEDWLPKLRENLQCGMGFAAARQQAVEALLREPVPELGARNDILALEYLKALREQGSGMVPCPLPRRADLPPASALRAQEDFFQALPPAAAQVFRRERQRGREVLPEALALPTLYRLRTMTEAEYAALEGAGEGLENRLRRAAMEAGSLGELIERCGAKRYPNARLRRLMLSALLQIPAGLTREIPASLRVLALNRKGAALLHDADPALPLITKAAKRPDDPVSRLEARTAAIYALGFADPAQRSGAWEYESPCFVGEMYQNQSEFDE